MKNHRIFVSPVENGMLADKAVSQGIKQYLKLYEGKKVKIAIEEGKKPRSIKQNAFYFGMILPAIRVWLLEQGINLDAEQTHEFVVRHVWKHTHIFNVDNEPCEIRLSSTQLDTIGWENKLEITREYFAGKGLELPYPHEYIFAG